MCIVADSVNSVDNTKIASMHVGYQTADGEIIGAQLVVYAAKVDSVVNSNAFILPVYNPGNDTKKIVPVDLSKMPDFFSDLEKIYDRWFGNYSSKGLKSQEYDSIPLYNLAPLQVHRVGQYKFSIMPSKLDFNRIDRSQLNVSPAAKKVIDYHSDKYSFIVYQFYQSGPLEITPFGYLCKPCQSDSMVIPTIHGHPESFKFDLLSQSNFQILGGVDSFSTYAAPNHSDNLNDFENISDFDHTIYTLVKTTNKDTTKADLHDLNGLLKGIQRDYLGNQIRIYVPKMFVPSKIEIHDRRDNRNIIISKNGYQFIKDLLVD